MSRAGTVIVGGGLAAQRVAETLRRRGYDRPPLSKELPAGTVGDDTAVVIGTDAPELMIEAAEACPAVAISIVDEATGVTVFP